jgi:hypothetical protein
MNMNSNSITGMLQSAAFMMEGLHDVGYDAAINAWELGCLELVTEMVQYAPIADKLHDMGYYENGFSCPGVFDYEVSSEFGRWFGAYVIANKTTPSRGSGEAELVRLSERFFSQ